ncbi:MAG: hypothetical protein NWE99_03675 [Candidatus Bathyarchaeota archaeon]|nr:hypothetical protein [Candidatus Bathyarchaeota archaeon]
MTIEKFFVNKSSFEILDTFRAYGLAFLVSGLSEEDIEVTIKDQGYAYIIEAKGRIPTEPDPALFVDRKEWLAIFRTYKERKDSKKDPPKKDVEKIITEEFPQILSTHKDPTLMPDISGNVKNGKTLYQTLDIACAKGYREEKRDVYHDGTQLEIDRFTWAVTCIGAAWASVWKETGSFILFMAPNPSNVLLGSHRVIQKELDERICPISSNTALVHYATKVTLLIAEKRLSHTIRYDSVIFNVMQKTGQQPKPAGGGRYGLDLLEKLANSPAGKNALSRIEQLFPISSKITGDKQSITFALTNFLLRPTLTNFRTFESLYIRGQVKGELYPWNKTQLGELLKYVEAA